jgi:DNA modification methylase
MKLGNFELNKIYCMDCLEGLKQLPDKSVDLVVTDPPYNIGKDFQNENLSKEEYLDWCKKWIKELNRVVDVGGAIYLTLGWQCVAEIKCLFNDIEDLRLKNWIVWYRQDGWKGNNGFAQSHEHILYFIKDNVPIFDLEKFGKHIKEARLKAGYKTVADCMEAMGLYTKVKRSNGTEDYYSGAGWFESGKKQPSLRELIKLNQLLELDEEYQVKSYERYKEQDAKKYSVFFNKTDVCDDVWLNPKSEKKRLGHPTQKPVKLFERIITASSNKGDVVLDPFMGSGTTAVACKQLGRNFIGFEISQEYVDIANKRLEQGVLF